MQFKDSAKSEFAKGADGWLVAFAKLNSYNLVTLEVFNPNIQRKVPIPNVCRTFQVQCFDTFEMLRALGIKFS